MASQTNARRKTSCPKQLFNPTQPFNINPEFILPDFYPSQSTLLARVIPETQINLGYDPQTAQSSTVSQPSKPGKATKNQDQQSFSHLPTPYTNQAPLSLQLGEPSRKPSIKFFNPGQRSTPAPRRTTSNVEIPAVQTRLLIPARQSITSSTIKPPPLNNPKSFITAKQFLPTATSLPDASSSAQSFNLSQHSTKGTVPTQTPPLTSPLHNMPLCTPASLQIHIRNLGIKAVFQYMKELEAEIQFWRNHNNMVVGLANSLARSGERVLGNYDGARRPQNTNDSSGVKDEDKNDGYILRGGDEMFEEWPGIGGQGIEGAEFDVDIERDLEMELEAESEAELQMEIEVVDVENESLLGGGEEGENGSLFGDY